MEKAKWIANVDAEALAEAIARALPFVSQDETRPHLCMVCIDVTKQHLTVAATDGHRLCTERVPCEGFGERRILLDRKHAHHLHQLLSCVERVSVRIHDDDDQLVLFEAAHLSMRVNPAREEFPPISRVMPETKPTAITFLNATYLRDALAVFEGGEPVKLELRGELDPVRFSNADGLALVMPLRQPDWDRK